jgi:hypothetical protein
MYCRTNRADSAGAAPFAELLDKGRLGGLRLFPTRKPNAKKQHNSAHDNPGQTHRPITHHTYPEARPSAGTGDFLGALTGDLAWLPRAEDLPPLLATEAAVAAGASTGEEDLAEACAVAALAEGDALLRSELPSLAASFTGLFRASEAPICAAIAADASGCGAAGRCQWSARPEPADIAAFSPRKLVRGASEAGRGGGGHDPGRASERRSGYTRGSEGNPHGFSETKSGKRPARSGLRGVARWISRIYAAF